MSQNHTSALESHVFRIIHISVNYYQELLSRNNSKINVYTVFFNVRYCTKCLADADQYYASRHYCSL